MRLVWSHIVAAALLAGGLLVPAGAGSAAEPLTLTNYVLDNGLQVLLVPDHRVPKVVLSVSYKVGGFNEPPGRSGFAHLFEHLMFSGTPAYPQIWAPFGALGVENNAFTRQDQTIYYEEGLASTLPVLLSIDADRMANLGNAVDQTELDTQRKVVLNEMREKFVSSPGSGSFSALEAGLYPKGHPYSHATIGSIPDIEAAQLGDVKAFFDTYYVPNNAVLTIVGDFDLATAKSEIAETFGIIPRGADVPTPSAEAFPPTKARYDIVDRVPTPAVMMGITGPGPDSPDNGALWLISELLSNPEYGFMHTHLVNAGTANYAFGGWLPAKLGGRFYVGGGAAPGVTAGDLEAALRKAIADFVAMPLDPVDVERARANLLLQSRVASEPMQAKALGIGMQATVTSDLSDALGDDKDLLATTMADVERVRKQLLADLPDATVVVTTPGPRGDLPPVLTESTGTPKPLVAADRPPVDVPKLSAGEPEAVELPVPETATLSNGIKVVHYRLAGAPMLYIAASVSGGSHNVAAGKEGLMGLTIAMAARGAGERDLDAFSKAAKDIGADISGLSGDTRSSVLLAVPPDAFDAGVPLLADAVQRPRFDQAAWDVLKRQRVQRIVGREADLNDVAARALVNQILIPGPGQAAPDVTLQSVSSIDVSEAKAFYEKLFVPSTLTFYSVGDLPVSAMVPALEKAFGSWKTAGQGLPEMPDYKVVFPAGRKVFFVPDEGAAQSILYVARPAPGLDQPGQTEAIGVMRLLGGDFLSRINTVMREEKGYTYGVDGSIWQSQRGESAMYVDAAVDAAATGPALEEMLAGFDSLAKTPVSADEVNRSVTAYLTGLASGSETAEGLMDALMGTVGGGMTLDEWQKMIVAVTKLEVGAVQSEAETLASLDRSVIVVAGDPKIVLPQLAAIGLTDITTLPRAKVE